MTAFKPHDLESVPEGSRETLAQVKQKYGFVPNLMGVLAESPAALNAYLSLGALVEKSSFTPVEQQALFLAVSVENRCEYCVSAHSAIAKMQQVPEQALEALRQEGRIEDPRLQALSRFAREVVRQKGWVSEEEVEQFLSAGFTKAQMLEVLVVVAMKTLSNYTNHIADTPLDEAFKPSAWTAATVR